MLVVFLQESRHELLYQTFWYRSLQTFVFLFMVWSCLTVVCHTTNIEIYHILIVWAQGWHNLYVCIIVRERNSSEVLVLYRILPVKIPSDDKQLSHIGILRKKTEFLIFMALCMCLICRCNEGNNQSASWNPAESSHCNRRRILPQEMQNDLERLSSQDLPPPPPPSPLPHPHSLPLLEKHRPIVTTSNGRSDLLGRALGQGVGPGQGGSVQGLTQCRGLGAGDCGPGLGVGRNPLVQELSELEGQILVIKQQLQSAMRRKRELEQYQSENQQANQTAPSQSSALQSNQFAQYTQSHQQTNQHTNTLPEFWSLLPLFYPEKPG